MKISSKITILCSMLVMAACGSDNNNPVVGVEPPPATLKLQVLHGSPDAPAVNVLVDGKVRIVHASPTVADVDIYVTAVGADISAESPTLATVAFKANTGYLALPAGDYDLTVTVAGTKTAAIGPATISVVDGGIYTAVARDPLPGATEFGLIVLDDFVSSN